MSSKTVSVHGLSPHLRLTRLWVLLIVAALFAMGTITALAVHDLGLFQLDRNVADDGAGDDWENVFTGTDNTAIDDTGIIPDIGADGGTQFQAGGSKDNNDISQWLWKAGEPLDKDDITNAYAAAYQSPIDTGGTNVGDLIIYFGMDRFDTNGSAQVGFWFLQNDVTLSDTPSGGGFKFNGVHAVNDVLVQSNFTNGGQISNITVFKWVGSGGSHGTLDQIFTGADCVGPPAIGADDTACATVNQAVVDPPWPYTDKGGNTTFQTSAFFEGGINLTRLIPNVGCLSTFIAETRSSTPFDARLKDLVRGNLDTCTRDVEVTKTAVTDPINAGDVASFTILVESIGNSTAEDVTLTDNLPDGIDWSESSAPCGIVPDTGTTGQVLTCNIGDMAPGATFTVTVSGTTDVGDCGVLTNTATVATTSEDSDPSNNSSTDTITVRCGALKITKTAKHKDPSTSPNLAATFTVVDSLGNSHQITTNASGAGCGDGMAIGLTQSITETVVPAGYAAPTISNVNVTAGDCENGTFTGASLSVTNTPLTNVQISVDSQHDGATQTVINCWNGTDTSGAPPFTATVSDGSLPIANLLPTSPSVTLTCTITIDP